MGRLSLIGRPAMVIVVMSASLGMVLCGVGD
jgi:hypothetical protein